MKILHVDYYVDLRDAEKAGDYLYMLSFERARSRPWFGVPDNRPDVGSCQRGIRWEPPTTERPSGVGYPIRVKSEAKEHSSTQEVGGKQ